MECTRPIGSACTKDDCRSCHWLTNGKQPQNSSPLDDVVVLPPMSSEALSLQFEIRTHDEPAAGIIGTVDEVVIYVESGDPGGEPGEFEDYIRQALLEWYDGGRVTKI